MVTLSVSHSTDPALLTDAVVLVDCVFISLEVVKSIFCRCWKQGAGGLKPLAQQDAENFHDSGRQIHI